ncbi:MAG: phosphonate metabolism protein/1,5-bisphosphokinase (PRPP-forming) PhnN [Alphaproteobacteria bacterium]|nr:phosphonate metabolism protein/1,5-bisphosphokinase (PRPP-forming) PhnN [Alphaproteobacteria bacterium]
MANTGYFIAVVGASGVGKDTILDGVKTKINHRDDFHFTKRFITRPQNAGGEDHIPLSVDEFKSQQQQGNFALWWTAHNLFYGLPKNILPKLNQGQNVIANISRKSVADAAHIFNKLLVIEITASPDVISQRLRARGRETQAEITKRQARKVNDWASSQKVISVLNDDEPQIAIDQFVNTLLSLA